MSYYLRFKIIYPHKPDIHTEHQINLAVVPATDNPIDYLNKKYGFHISNGEIVEDSIELFDANIWPHIKIEWPKPNRFRDIDLAPSV